MTTLPSNGRLPTAQLSPLANFAPIEAGAGGLATAEAARQWSLMAAAFARDLGYELTASEGYRDLARQSLKWAQYQGGGSLAAYPGTSNHGLAVAVDVASGVGYPGTPGGIWMDRHARAYGFTNDVPSEHWHWHYVGSPTITTPPAAPAEPAERKQRKNMIVIVGVPGHGIWVLDYGQNTRYNIAAGGLSTERAYRKRDFMVSTGVSFYDKQAPTVLEGFRDITGR